MSKCPKVSRKRAGAAQHTKVNADGTVVNFVAHIGWLVWGGREVRMEEVELFAGSAEIQF